MFKANESSTDRIVRAVVGVVLLWLSLGPLGGFGTVLGIIVFVISIIALVTAITGFCLLYKLFGISTCGK